MTWTEVEELVDEFRTYAREYREAKSRGAIAPISKDDERYERYADLVEQLLVWETEKENAFQRALEAARVGDQYASYYHIWSYVCATEKDPVY